MIEKDTTIIVKELYDIVKKSLDKNSRKFLANIHEFINDRHEQMFATAPYENIYFNAKDLDKLYKALGFTENDILPLCQNIVYWDWPGYNPGCAKEPYVLVLLCCIRYYLKNSERKNAEITAIYLAFSGKIYASLYGMEWKYSPKNAREVMDYVVNNMLSDKFDLKKEGSVFGAIKKLCITWIDTYESDIKANDTTDDEWGKILQQLRDRVKSFIKNIGKLFYEAYKNKYYLNYETDNVDPDNFRLTDNDAATAARLTEATMNLLTSQKVDLQLCKYSTNDNIRDPKEIQIIIERILSDSNNLPEVRRVINIIICDYLENHRGKRVGSTDFVRYSLQPKPNTKSKALLEQKDIVIGWMMKYYDKYGKTNREATRNNYRRAIMTYFVYTICKTVS
ncbi:MAG: hypothetical protein IKR19_08655 [Acholeplasmatales bacterium]|nr:hypothetical protein [Acholeplasmatales bacterium]